MSTSKVIDAIMRLTGEDLPEGQSILLTKVPGGELQVLRLLIRQTTMNVGYEDHEAFGGDFANPIRVRGHGDRTLTLEAHVLEES